MVSCRHIGQLSRLSDTSSFILEYLENVHVQRGPKFQYPSIVVSDPGSAYELPQALKFSARGLRTSFRIIISGETHAENKTDSCQYRMTLAARNAYVPQPWG